MTLTLFTGLSFFRQLNPLLLQALGEKGPAMEADDVTAPGG